MGQSALAAENVWDYPRPPRLEAVLQTVQVDFGGVTIVRSQAAYRVLETSHAPTYYIPPSDILDSVLQPSARGRSMCEWKGTARYFDVVVGDQSAEGAA